MSRTSPRLAGVLVSAAILVVAGLLWRGCLSGAPAPGSETSAPPRRGGQLVASARGVPRTFNRLVAVDQPSDMFATLTQGSLVRMNRATFELEPWLAEKWESSADGRTHTLHLRQGVTWSDGTPFTSADVLFSLQALYDPKVESVVGEQRDAGRASRFRRRRPTPPRSSSRMPRRRAPGFGLLDMLPILPKHKLEAALAAGTFAKAWDTGTPPAEIVGTGSVRAARVQAGPAPGLRSQPALLAQGARRQTLPYLDRIVLEVVPEQNAELLRLQSGATDLTQSELRPDDYVPVRRAEEEGKLTLIELGVGTRCRRALVLPEAGGEEERPALRVPAEARVPPGASRTRSIARSSRRRCSSARRCRSGARSRRATGRGSRRTSRAIPTTWPRARELLKSIGLEDRNGNGVVEDGRRGRGALHRDHAARASPATSAA